MMTNIPFTSRHSGRLAMSAACLVAGAMSTVRRLATMPARSSSIATERRTARPNQRTDAAVSRPAT